MASFPRRARSPSLGDAATDARAAASISPVPLPGRPERLLDRLALDHATIALAVLELPALHVARVNSALVQLWHRLDADGASVERWLPRWLETQGVLGHILLAAKVDRPISAQLIELTSTEDGTPLTLAYDVVPLPEPAESAASGRSVLLQLRDCTEEQHARADGARALYAAQLYAEQLETAIDQLADGVIIRDTTGQVRAYNRAALDYAHNRHAVERARTHGRRVEPRWELLSVDGLPTAEMDEPAWRALLTNAPVVGGQYTLRREDGTYIPVIMDAAPLQAEDGTSAGVVIAVHDITAVKDIERLKDEFISIASHELRQPLTVIQGQGQMLGLHLGRIPADAPVPPLVRDKLESLVAGIGIQTARLNGLVADLLDMSRIQAGQLRLETAPTAALELVREVVSQQREAAHAHALTLEAPAGAQAERWRGQWDRRRVEQILMNLLSNGIKYSPAGGAIAVRVSLLPAGHTPAPSGAPEATGARPVAGPAIRITVRDSGIGIPRDALPHLFERFYRAHNALDIEGTGLGLYICRRLAWELGGDLWAESPGVDQGTTLCLVLPLLAEPAAE